MSQATPAFTRSRHRGSRRAAAAGAQPIPVTLARPTDPPTESAAALREMVEEGPISHVGAADSTWPSFARSPLRDAAASVHLFRRDIEAGVLPYAAEHDLGAPANGPIAHGVLDGGFDEHTTFPADDWRVSGAGFRRHVGVVGDRRFAERRGGLDRTPNRDNLTEIDHIMSPACRARTRAGGHVMTTVAVLGTGRMGSAMAAGARPGRAWT
ncbi:aldo/keto reductase [Nonomuraea sp. NPDC049709]|uniref:aldo/keto reductase n=1 Tax=Nonomuraea sp. NPDC049709 TaxID=3154736 RepID=UPI0034490207